jgi:hypothetical protein
VDEALRGVSILVLMEVYLRHSNAVSSYCVRKVSILVLMEVYLRLSSGTSG